MGLPQDWPPSVERLMKTVGTTRLRRSGIEEMSQTLCLASKATEASLTRSYGLLGSTWKVRPGRTPLVKCAPLLVDVANPMSDDPPLKNRPTWKVDTTVEPNEKVSGSTSVRWLLVGLVSGSELICVNAACVARAVHDRATTNPAAKAPAGTSFFMAIPPIALASSLRDRHTRHDLLLVVRAVGARVVGADEGRDDPRAADRSSEVVTDKGPDAGRAARMRRVKLRIEGVLGEPDVAADSLQVRAVELDARVDAVIGRSIWRQAAGVAGV